MSSLFWEPEPNETRREKAYRSKTLALQTYLLEKKTWNVHTHKKMKKIANFAHHMLEIEMNHSRSFLRFLFLLSLS